MANIHIHIFFCLYESNFNAEEHMVCLPHNPSDVILLGFGMHMSTLRALSPNGFVIPFEIFQVVHSLYSHYCPQNFTIFRLNLISHLFDYCCSISRSCCKFLHSKVLLTFPSFYSIFRSLLEVSALISAPYLSHNMNIICKHIQV